MAKYIYNITAEAKTYQGREIAASAFYQITDNLLPEYASDSQLIADLASGIVKMSSDGSSALIGSGSAQVDFLKNTTPPNIAASNYPFASKILPNGKKLYARVHGIQASVSGDAYTIDFVIPYNDCKLTGIEIIGGNTGDTINLKVLDTPAGTISGIADYMLNQFGFDVNVSKDFYERDSAYDADLIKDMKIRIEYDSASTLPIPVYINFILHEVKD
jgi:hypothetical protein